MYLKVKRVDMYGFLGRDRHPTPALEGQIVRPVKMDLIYFNEGGSEFPVYDADHVLPESIQFMFRNVETGPEDCRGLMEVWTCVTPSGSLVDLLSHEVEAHTSLDAVDS